MPHDGRKINSGRKMGYLSVAGPQYRFIIFLLVVLGVYTLLLTVFQKIAEFLQFPVFFPIALVTLLLFVGMVGATYSHTIVGPLLRIRSVLQHMVGGDANISVRLRESDDPMLKDIVKEIILLCEHSRNFHALLQDTIKEHIKDVAALQEILHRGAEKTEIQEHLHNLQKKQEQLNRLIKSTCKL